MENITINFILVTVLAGQGVRLVTEYREKSIIIFGCGNILFGDDGLGPEVAEQLEREYDIPEHIAVINAGNSIREFLFNIALDEKKPEKIIIVDAMDVGKEPGEIFEIGLDDLPENKIDDFSMHQIPTSNLLRELRDFCGVDVRILSCQVEKIPEEVEPGLSDTLKAKKNEMCKLIAKKYFQIS
jgi:coenzyme F420 hydrogenase subunit delta